MWRSPLGNGQAAPPRRSPTSPGGGGAACRGEDPLRWNSVSETEARRGGQPAFPHSPAGLASAILGTVARPPRLPALPLCFGSSASETDFEGRRMVRAPGGVRAGSGASRERPGSGWGPPGLAGALPVEMARDGPGLPPSAVSAGRPGLAGLRVSSDADAPDERGWRWGRKANGDGGAPLPSPGQRRQRASFVMPPPGGEGAAGRLPGGGCRAGRGRAGVLS